MLDYVPEQGWLRLPQSKPHGSLAGRLLARPLCCGTRQASFAAKQANSAGNPPRLLLRKSLGFMLPPRVDLETPTARQAGAR
jgi:hypothetical protein